MESVYLVLTLRNLPGFLSLIFKKKKKKWRDEGPVRKSDTYNPSIFQAKTEYKFKASLDFIVKIYFKQ